MRNPGLERINWSDHESRVSTINDGRKIIVEKREPFRVKVLPKLATVVAKPSAEGWGGAKGITYFIHQAPAVETVGETGFISPESYHAMAEDLFGRIAVIKPDEKIYWPPELPEILVP